MSDREGGEVLERVLFVWLYNHPAVEQDTGAGIHTDLDGHSIENRTDPGLVDLRFDLHLRQIGNVDDLLPFVDR